MTRDRILVAQDIKGGKGYTSGDYQNMTDLTGKLKIYILQNSCNGSSIALRK